MTTTTHDRSAATRGSRQRVLVAALGDVDHGDAGWAAHVVRELPVRDLPAGVTVTYYGTRTDVLLEDLREGWDAVVLLDALPDRGCPGALTVVDVDARRQVVLSHGAVDGSRGAEVLEVARRTGAATVVVGCEAVAVDERLGLTGDVEDCVGPAARFVVSLLERLDRRPLPDGPRRAVG